MNGRLVDPVQWSNEIRSQRQRNYPNYSTSSILAKLLIYSIINTSRNILQTGVAFTSDSRTLILAPLPQPSDQSTPRVKPHSWPWFSGFSEALSPEERPKPSTESGCTHELYRMSTFFAEIRHVDRTHRRRIRSQDGSNVEDPRYWWWVRLMDGIQKDFVPTVNIPYPDLPDRICPSGRGSSEERFSNGRLIFSFIFFLSWTQTKNWKTTNTNTSHTKVKD